MIYSVTFVAQGTAEGMPGHPSQAVISITTPEEGHADLADFGHLLRLQFHDVEENSGSKYTLFDASHAAQVIEFVNRLHTDPDPIDVTVHCKAGISRSAAIALYVHETTGCSFPRRPFAGFANRLVISVLKDASGRQPIPPRALIRRESFSVNVLRDFENGSTLVTAENNRSQERAQIEGPIADEAAIIGQAVVQIAGFQEPPPAHEVQDWDFSL